MIHENVRLGKLPPRRDERTLRLAKYIDHSVLPTPPAETARAHARQTPFRMYGNDQLGDCTIAGIGNLTQFWASLGGVCTPFTDEQVVNAYETVCGYKPGDPSTDNGAVELDVLRTWRKTGIGGHRIEAFAGVDLGNEDLIRAAAFLFDGLYIGVMLPKTAQHQAVWDYDPAAGVDALPDSWGSHCVIVVDYNATGPVIATWGAVKQTTWSFLHAYCDEAYAVMTAEQLDGTGHTAEGFDTEQLRADLADITG